MHVIDANIAGIGLNLIDNIMNSKLVINNVIKNPRSLSPKKDSPKTSIN
tara:strand:+ start:599 stop:745 length:147 start_codon:yes stop_codon:yes gene_type:complete